MEAGFVPYVRLSISRNDGCMVDEVDLEVHKAVSLASQIAYSSFEALHDAAVMQHGTELGRDAEDALAIATRLRELRDAMLPMMELPMEREEREP